MPWKDSGLRVSKAGVFTPLKLSFFVLFFANPCPLLQMHSFVLTAFLMVRASSGWDECTEMWMRLGWYPSEMQHSVRVCRRLQYVALRYDAAMGAPRLLRLLRDARAHATTENIMLLTFTTPQT
jgi:hypothetical protein